MSCYRDPMDKNDHDIVIIDSEDEDVEAVEDLDGQEPPDDLGEDDQDEHEDMDIPVPVFTPSRDDALRYFQGHTDLVFTVHLAPSGYLAVSGGKDDRGWLWNVEDGSPILELGGFSDSVPYVGFSHDERFVMASDMAGKVQVWDVSSKELVFSTEADEITWTLWHPTAHILLAGSQDGTISMWMIPAGNIKVMQSFGESTMSAKFLPDGKRLLAGYADGTIRLWDLKTCKCTTTMAKVHEGEVLSLDVNSNGLVASGGADGLKFATLATGKQVLSLQNFEDCVECVAFAKMSDQPWLAAGSLDGTLLVWDTTAGQARHRVEFGTKSGICQLAWVGSDHILAASLDGVIREVDARSGAVVKEWQGHTSSLLDLSVSGVKFATASEDRRVGIFGGVVS